MSSDDSPEKGMKSEHGMGGTGAVFLTLTNDGRESDWLIAAASGVAETVEIHQTTIEDEIMRMQPVARVEIPAGGGLELKPGGYHIMLLGLRSDLEVGDLLRVTLTYERSRPLVVEAEVRKP
jgi:copper(I)-binding protein